MTTESNEKMSSFFSDNSSDNQDDNVLSFKSKKDGKTYIARKLTVKNGDKDIKGVYIFAEGAKPDEKGNVPGEFLPMEAFVKKLSEEL